MEYNFLQGLYVLLNFIIEVSTTAFLKTGSGRTAKEEIDILLQLSISNL